MLSFKRSAGLMVLISAAFVAGACDDDNDITTPTPSPTPVGVEPTPTPEPVAPEPSPSPADVVSFLAKLRDIDPIMSQLTLSEGRKVQVDGGTTILRDGQNITMGQLVLGETLRVKGRVQAGDIVLAERIEADPYNEQ
jgi:hypothetical protein